MSEIELVNGAEYRLRIRDDVETDQGVLAFTVHPAKGVPRRFEATRDHAVTVYNFLGRVLYGEASETEPVCTCGRTACESDRCDCDAAPCPVDHAAEPDPEPECPWIPGDAAPACDWDDACPVHGQRPAPVSERPERCNVAESAYGRQCVKDAGHDRNGDPHEYDPEKGKPIPDTEDEPTLASVLQNSNPRRLRVEALRAAVSVWTAVNNADPATDTDDVIGWAREFEHYLKTGEARVEPCYREESGVEHGSMTHVSGAVVTSPEHDAGTDTVTDPCTRCGHGRTVHGKGFSHACDCGACPEFQSTGTVRVSVPVTDSGACPVCGHEASEHARYGCRVCSCTGTPR
jgi:hypothetical protein